jgi:hypothetical protein
MDLYYKDRTLSFSLKSRRAHARNRTSDKGGRRNGQSAKYDRFSPEYVVLLQLEKLYTYECIDTVLFCVAKVLIHENMPTERYKAYLKSTLFKNIRLLFRHTLYTLTPFYFKHKLLPRFRLR